MTTRRANPGAAFSQERYASSSEYEQGLIASMVARRCSVIDDAKDRELVWFIQWLSWKVGLKSFAATLIKNYPERIGTPAMVKLGKCAGKKYDAEQVREIRSQLPEEFRKNFLLRGETLGSVCRVSRQAETRRKNESLFGDSMATEELERENKEAVSRPNSYPVEELISLCASAAHEHLENFLRDFCLNPAIKIKHAAPWYFAGIVDALRGHCVQWDQDRRKGVVVTAVGRKVIDAIEYSPRTRRILLLEGLTRTGKSTAGRNECEARPGLRRIIEVPPGNDETSFYRHLLRCLGEGSLSQYKAHELRERLERILLSGGLVIVLDEVHRLWPQQTERRFGFPKRIEWVRFMSDQGVHFVLLSTPQFIDELKAKKDEARWESGQLQGRLFYERLPDRLSNDEVKAVAAAQIPEADRETIEAIVDYANRSAQYLAAVETIADKARYIASKDGRDTAIAEDFADAIRDSVLRCDSNLVSALENKKAAAKRRKPFSTSAKSVQPPAAVLPDRCSLEAPGRRSDLDPVEM